MVELFIRVVPTKNISKGKKDITQERTGRGVGVRNCLSLGLLMVL